MSTPNKIILSVFIIILAVLAWAPWLTNDKAKEIVKTYPNFQRQHNIETGQENPEISVWPLPFCRWLNTYEGGWFVCFWQTESNTKQANTTNPAPQINSEEDTNQNQGTEQTIYNIMDVEQKDGQLYLTVKSARMFSGDKAQEQAIKETGCPMERIKNGDCAPSLNNGFYISKQLSPEQRLAVSDDAQILVLDYTTVQLMQVNRGEFFKSYTQTNGVVAGGFNTPFTLEIKDGQINRVEQQYIP